MQQIFSRSKQCFTATHRAVHAPATARNAVRSVERQTLKCKRSASTAAASTGTSMRLVTPLSALIGGVIGGLLYQNLSSSATSPPNSSSSDDYRPPTQQAFESALGEVKQLLPDDCISQDDNDLLSHGSSDWQYHYPAALPGVILYPRSTEDVSRIVKIAAKHRIPVVSYAGGTSLEGSFFSPAYQKEKGAIQLESENSKEKPLPGLAFSLDFSENMNQIIKLHEGDLDVVVQPGIGYEVLNDSIKDSKLFFPVDPGPGAMIGGMIGTGCSGTNAVRYGTMRDNVLNMTIVMPDGEVVKTRQRAKKCSAGPDFGRYFIGSEGTLGIVTEATLKLAPVLPYSVGVSSFKTVEAAASCVRDLVQHGVNLQCIELLDDDQVRCVNKQTAGQPDARQWPEEPALFLKFQGADVILKAEIDRTANLVAQNGGTKLSFAKSEKEKEDLWYGRKVALWSALDYYPGSRCIVTDVCVPISAFPELIKGIKEDVEASGIAAPIVSHAADGNVHALVMFKNEEERKKAKDVVHRMVKRAQALDGTCTGEHGVGIGKSMYLEAELGSPMISVLRKIKKTLDPLNIMNRDGLGADTLVKLDLASRERDEVPPADNSFARFFRPFNNRPAISRSLSSPTSSRTPIASRSSTNLLLTHKNADRPNTAASQTTLSPSLKSASSNTLKSRLTPKRPFFRRKSASIKQLNEFAEPTSSLSANASVQHESDSLLDAGDTTPLNDNAFFNAQTPLAHPSIDSFASFKSLVILMLQPTILTLTQLAPHSIVPSDQSSSPYPTSSVDAPSTTSLSTYVSENTSGFKPTPSVSTVPSIVIGQTQYISFNEQLAGSALTLPTVSVAAIWRAAKTIQWLNDNIQFLTGETESYMDFDMSANQAHSAKAPSSIPVAPFELGSLLQNVLDILSSYAASIGVELVLYHGQHPSSDYSYIKLEGGLKELVVKGDEIGFGLALMTIVCQILGQAKAGDAIELGMSLQPLFATNPTMNRPNMKRRDTSDTARSVASSPSVLSENENENSPKAKNWQVTIELCHTVAQHNVDEAQALLRDDVLARQSLISMVAKYFKFMISPMQVSSDKAEGVLKRRFWYIETHMLQHGVDEGHSKGRRKSVTDGIAPSIPELFRFAEVSLKGKKVVIHSTESSIFAKHLTGYLTSWGLEPSHVGPERAGKDEKSSEGSPEIAQHEPRATILRTQSHGSEKASATTLQDQSSTEPHRTHSKQSTDTSSSLDPNTSFLFIDDDISTLRKQLVIIKNNAPSLHIHQSYLNKRPGLANRRTKSTAQIRPRDVHLSLIIVYFTSLQKFRFIRELVQSIFRSVSHMFPLPEVVVLPKPVGPRRLLTALHTSLRRPHLDQAVVPIATSPSSPGGTFFLTASGRPSPAPSSQQDFDIAFAEAGRAATEPSSLGPVVASPRTPPTNVLQLHDLDPPSPRHSAEAVEYLEYVSKSSEELGGSASSGIVIQSPDGRASGLFFHPIKRVASNNAPSSTADPRSSAVNGSKMIRERIPLSEAAPLNPNRSDSHSPSSSPATPLILSPPLNAHDLPSLSEASTAMLQNQSSSPSLVSAREIGLGASHKDVLASPNVESSARALSLEEFTYSPVVDDEAFQRSRSPTNGPPAFLRMSTAPSLNTQAAYSHSRASPIPTSPSPTSAAKFPTTSPTSPQARESQTTSQLPSSPLAGASKSTKPITPAPSARRRESKSTEPRKGTAKSGRKSGGASASVVPPINVLIVEDNPINLTIMSTFLRRKGVKHSVAANGQEAVDKWKIGAFHLVLMDIQLPVKNGIEATQEIREIERNNNIAFQETPTVEASEMLSSGAFPTPVTSPHHLPVIIVALTASSSQTDRIAALAAGCNDFITKPVSLPWFNQKMLEWGSMSILSSFSHRRRAKSSSTSLQNINFDQGASQMKADKIAAQLHIERRAHPSIGASNDQSSAIGTPTSPETVDSN